VSCRLRRGAALFASPGKLTSVWCHDEIDLTALSPGDGCEFWVTMKQSRWRAKNKATERLPSPKAGSACNPIDSVSVAGSVQVQQNLIS
jgi:hypothetical protein